MAKQSFLKRLGLDEVEGKLTAKVCNQRVKHLRKSIDAGKYKGRLLEQAQYYMGWYKWRAKNNPNAKKKTSRRAS
jgi:hypothetical protein